ncbi:putative TIM-barrel fold metal-dependent hydrolase [Prosthecobacter fusiformis]|uniref:Putative TIM-barrel fold metal-dependent hydrolase n=1 Tax=Prosthecobacter fusiformis TaxID=48464 RepID=A0A4R7STP1_9BACT|nr:amidohydrolase family protein [Prosthecobacter fusiformis]TDU81667.1 putative TIM-barrel fold metal-dependent hydrolase [Prosthecobacter fusiformis]
MKRRRFIQTAALGALLPGRGSTQETTALRVIDTHTHFYDPSRPGGVPWPKKDTPLYRTVLPADWQVLANPLGIHETVVVEASPLVEDNQWILDLAAREKCIVGFVGNLDPNDSQFVSNLKRFAANPLFRGIRWRGDLVRLDEHHDQVCAAARLLAELGLELDVNGPPTSLPHVARLAEEVPDLRIVINHLGGAGDPQNLKPEWKENIRLVAKQPRVFMKVSGMPEQVRAEEGQAPRDTEYYLPVLEHLWECFGPDRLIYGSNWPVSDRGAAYETVFKLVSEYFQGKGQEAAQKYFWRNAKAAYQWVDRA